MQPPSFEQMLAGLFSFHIKLEALTIIVCYLGKRNCSVFVVVVVENCQFFPIFDAFIVFIAFFFIAEMSIFDLNLK